MNCPSCGSDFYEQKECVMCGYIQARWTIWCGDALSRLRQMESSSVHCCVTSPPYWGLRDYGVEGQLGLEKTPEEYVAKLVEIFREVRRVLRDDGTLWLNLGDSYARAGGWSNNNGLDGVATRQESSRPMSNIPTSGVSQKLAPGLKEKDLVGIPWMVAFALRADGWYLRQDIIWHKPNPMPESVRDRCTKAHEYVFMLSKSARYYFDSDAVKEEAVGCSGAAASFKRTGSKREQTIPGQGYGTHRPDRPDVDYGGETRNRRSVWTVATKPFKGAHFATFPPALIESCVMAGCPVGGIVLDPFAGSGTTGEVALKHHRNFEGIELNPTYAETIMEPRLRAAEETTK